MVAAEAAAAGCPPIVARHSGLAEVAGGAGGRAAARAGAARELADRRRRRAARAARDVARARRPPTGTTLRAGVRRAVEGRWSWASVASQLAAIGAG